MAGTSMLTWLPKALRDAGADVYVLPGAETRTTRSTGLVVRGVVWHHTATSKAWADGHVAALLRDGRRDLAGPLSQIGIERDGTVVIVALGRANHNGYGTWGNDSIGLEFYNAGDGEPFTAAQMKAGILVTAAIAKHERLDVAVAVRAHRETDPQRKIDPRANVVDMAGVRQSVARKLAAPKPAPPAEPIEEIEMLIYHVPETKRAYFDNGQVVIDITDLEKDFWALAAKGVKVVGVSKTFVARLGAA